MSAKHTPGLLHVDPKRSLRIATDQDESLASTGTSDVLRDSWEANARRLVACWNAFDGLTTDQIESMVNVPEFFFKQLELMAQRDELLAALERTTEMCEQYADWIKRNVMSADIEQHPYLPELEGAAEDARAAIAEVKGGAA